MRALGEWSEWLTSKVQFLQLCFDSEQIDEHPSASAKKVDGLHTSDIISSTRLFGDFPFTSMLRKSSLKFQEQNRMELKFPRVRVLIFVLALHFFFPAILKKLSFSILA